ncbi:hypothetical protein ACRALDRAFT_208284, partial [Sodiomyces alcalophilus JCM 7366]|uniref:uncharacterized protein n=1 Tax=Sodiomyces alcalophilus JCM 7366 TaxID=591952 RepID=UPI0039B5AF16
MSTGICKILAVNVTYLVSGLYGAWQIEAYREVQVRSICGQDLAYAAKILPMHAWYSSIYIVNRHRQSTSSIYVVNLHEDEDKDEDKDKDEDEDEDEGSL